MDQMKKYFKKILNHLSLHKFYSKSPWERTFWIFYLALCILFFVVLLIGEITGDGVFLIRELDSGNLTGKVETIRDWSAIFSWGVIIFGTFWSILKSILLKKEKLDAK